MLVWRYSVVVAVLCGFSVVATLSCTSRVEPPAPLPAPVEAPGPSSTERYPTELKKLVDEIRGWQHYQATLTIGAQQHALATTKVLGVPSQQKLRVESNMGAGPMAARTEAVFDGQTGVARSSISGKLPEGMPAALKLGVAAGAGNKHLRVNQAVLGSPSAPYVSGFSLGTTGLGAGLDLQGTLLALLDADGWREVEATTIDGVACRVFEATDTADSAFARAQRWGSPALLQLEEPTTRDAVLKSMSEEPGKIAIGPSGELVAALLGRAGLMLRVTSLDTTKPPDVDAFSVASLDVDDADDVSAAVRSQMEPLALLLADRARLDALSKLVREGWIANHPPAPPDAGAAGSAASATGARHMTLGPPRVLGKLDAALITKTLEEHASQMSYCYEKQLKTHRSLKGQLLVRFVINGEGTVTLASVVEDKLLPRNAALQECLLPKIKTHRYPPVKGGGIVIVNQPFEFTPG